MQPLIRLLVLGGLCILLTGCKIELYSGLSEREGNEMLAILLGHGIPATKMTSIALQNSTNCPGMRLVPSQIKVVLLAP